MTQMAVHFATSWACDLGQVISSLWAIHEHPFIRGAFEKLPSEVQVWENVRVSSLLFGFLMRFSVRISKKSEHLETRVILIALFWIHRHKLSRLNYT